MARATASRSAAKPKKSAEDHADATLNEVEEQTTEDVLHAFQSGRADAKEAARKTLPAIKKSVSKGTYMTCYYLAFGVVYTAELAMSVVPEDSVIRSGFRDGTAAAKEAYVQRKDAHVAESLQESPA